MRKIIERKFGIEKGLSDEDAVQMMMQTGHVMVSGKLSSVRTKSKY